MRLFRKFALIFLLGLGVVPGLAQQSGFRDLTQFWRVPDDKVPSPSSTICTDVKNTISNGQQLPVAPEPQSKLEFTITQISPSKLQVGKTFTATIQLKNAGLAAVRIPWEPDGQQVAHASQNAAELKEEEYEVADVGLQLAKKGTSRSFTPLHSEGALFANPSDSATYIPVEPGHWVQIKLNGMVACGLSHCISEIAAGEHTLSAWWYQRVLTHRVSGCTEDHGAYTVREQTSEPIPVVVGP